VHGILCHRLVCRCDIRYFLDGDSKNNNGEQRLKKVCEPCYNGLLSERGIKKPEPEKQHSIFEEFLKKI
jgi:hypothetical protein